MVDLYALTSFLDQYLPPSHPVDSSVNGLQVSNNGTIDRIYLAVDGTLELFLKAKNPSNALFFVHHGLFWKKQEVRILGAMKKKIEFMFQHNASLYASHLPLDSHMEHGNNAMMLKQLGFISSQFNTFGDYHGHSIGLWADFPKAMDIQELIQKIASFSPTPIHFQKGEKQSIQRVAVITGDGCDFVREADILKADLFITGEFSLQSYTYSKEAGINVLYLTHYGSEKWGVISIGNLLEKTFSLECEFLEACPKVTLIAPTGSMEV